MITLVRHGISRGPGNTQGGLLGCFSWFTGKWFDKAILVLLNKKRSKLLIPGWNSSYQARSGFIPPCLCGNTMLNKYPVSLLSLAGLNWKISRDEVNDTNSYALRTPIQLPGLILELSFSPPCPLFPGNHDLMGCNNQFLPIIF